jgi:pSer/pThr/pTyr-binding forkhead associated (FHA) protein
LNKARTNIGRTVEVYRAQGPSRRNDLAFTEENEINSTVSREHAHILYFKNTGEYRLYNDRWHRQAKNAASSCGLWIIRDGLSREVHRDARGVKLEWGDEIQFGRAIVKFQAR